MIQKAQLMDEKAVHRALMRISHEILEQNKGTKDLVLVGIRRRGEPMVRIIRDNIRMIEDVEVPCHSIDIRYYRDDLTHVADSPKVADETADFDVDGKKVIIVDDVIFTGRTTRAAIEAVMRRGRPALIRLAALVDRGHRELPIRADYIGKNVPTSRSERIDVHFPEFDGDTGVYLLDMRK